MNYDKLTTKIIIDQAAKAMAEYYDPQAAHTHQDQEQFIELLNAMIQAIRDYTDQDVIDLIYSELRGIYKDEHKEF